MICDPCGEAAAPCAARAWRTVDVSPRPVMRKAPTVVRDILELRV